MSNYDGSWHGGKGSRPRKLASKDNYDNNYGKAFGNRLTWLQIKKLKEAWLC